MWKACLVTATVGVKFGGVELLLILTVRLLYLRGVAWPLYGRGNCGGDAASSGTAATICRVVETWRPCCGDSFWISGH